jgi:hypothetical protein
LGSVGGDLLGDLAERLFAEGPRVREAAGERDDAMRSRVAAVFMPLTRLA